MGYVIGAIVLIIIIRKVTEPKVTHISYEDVQNMLKDKTKRQYIDVRTAGEFNSHKLKGFKNIPLQGLKNKTGDLSNELPIVLMCASGSRSMAAARVLKKAGFTDMINVKGGIK